MPRSLKNLITPIKLLEDSSINRSAVTKRNEKKIKLTIPYYYKINFQKEIILLSK